ncbi:MAG: AI-2E family transporter [Mariprofundaceae bacterium]
MAVRKGNMQLINNWLRIKLADKQLMILLVSLLALFVLLALVVDVLAPLLVAIAFAYVLEGIVSLLHQCRLPRLLAIILVGAGSLLLILFSLLAVVPLLTSQIGQLIIQIPDQVLHLKTQVLNWQADYAAWIDPSHIQRLLVNLADKLQEFSGSLLSLSLSSIPGLMTLLVYMVLVPVLVFFLLMDKDKVLEWSQHFLPKERTLLTQVWREVDIQIGNYIRGKFWEMVLIGAITGVAFAFFDHKYALLLGALTGISVWIPFVGIAVVSIPVVLLTLLQWGVSDTTLYALIVYTIIQLLDANVLVPWLFSEVVNLHPIAIIVAILVFGSLWGVLGVFIAIPLAALVQSVLKIMMNRKDVLNIGAVETK